jgi:hypothetical protein
MTPRRLFSQEVTWVKGGHVGKGRSGLGARPETRRVTDRQPGWSATYIRRRASRSSGEGEACNGRR